MMSDRSLTLESLLAMTPIVDNRDLVVMASRHLLLGQVKGQSGVQDVFFPDHRMDLKYSEPVSAAIPWFNTKEYAILYVCQAICKLEDEYGIHKLINSTSIEQRLLSIHSSSAWKKVGFALYTILFPDLVKDENTGIPFRKFMESEPKLWAKRLCDRIKDKKWIYRYLQPIVSGNVTRDVYNRDINILFVKLHLLDPTTVVSTFNYLSKALPDLSLELATTDYLGGGLEWSLIRNEVRRAIESESYPSNVSRLSLDEIEVFHGVRVCEFIMSEARSQDLWSGEHPTDNKRASTLSDRMCTIA